MKMQTAMKISIQITTAQPPILSMNQSKEFNHFGFFSLFGTEEIHSYGHLAEVCPPATNV
jgi:hypothetical protein